MRGKGLAKYVKGNGLTQLCELSIKSVLVLLLVAPMNTQQPRRRPNPKINFRVLIIGRANAGKTSILQRICETTENPVIYRHGREVHDPTSSSASQSNITAKQVELDPSMEVSENSNRTSLRLPLT